MTQAIDDLLLWAGNEDREEQLIDEVTIADYLDDYRRTRNPAPTTYHRRFILRRLFITWVSDRNGIPNPFIEPQGPARPRA